MSASIPGPEARELPARQGPRRVLVAALAGLVAIGLTLGVSPASAELVVMVDGSFMKAQAVAVEGDRARVVLPSGGAVVLPLLRIARVLDDEVPELADDAALAEIDDSAFELLFRPDQPRPEGPYGELIYAAAERHGLNPALVAAVARAESAFAVEATSHKGARGLMQLMPATAQRFGVPLERITDPALNVDAGARYLRWLTDRFGGELAHVLAGYNAGEGTVDRYGGVPPYRETRGYVRRIFATLGLDAAPILDPPAHEPGPSTGSVVASFTRSAP